ncbi:hypothetical protein PMAYCL1PPCAC_08041, partial [Pristionchus mayeri]
LVTMHANVITRAARTMSKLWYSTKDMSCDWGRSADDGPNSAANSTVLKCCSFDEKGFFASLAAKNCAFLRYESFSSRSLIAASNLSVPIKSNLLNI